MTGFVNSPIIPSVEEAEKGSADRAATGLLRQYRDIHRRRRQHGSDYRRAEGKRAPSAAGRQIARLCAERRALARSSVPEPVPTCLFQRGSWTSGSRYSKCNRSADLFVLNQSAGADGAALLPRPFLFCSRNDHSTAKCRKAFRNAALSLLAFTDASDRIIEHVQENGRNPFAAIAILVQRVMDHVS